LYGSLLNGASLFPFDIKSEGTHHLVTWLSEEEITICHLPPAVFRQLADAIAGPETLPHLRLIHLSGAPITRQDFDVYKKKFSSTTFLAIRMGSTEAGLISSAIVDQTFSFPNEGSAIGYPAPGVQILLLDQNENEVGPGEIGEIAIKSGNLNSGYWKKPELNRTKFVSDPVREDERIFLTGDLARKLPDGFLIHMGRKDYQVKIRGYRVELSEIERVLREHPLVKDVGVVAWGRKSGEKYLAAYVVPQDDPTPTVSDLIDFLKVKLPDYMIPSRFMFLRSLPLNNGKLNRTALPEPNNKRPELVRPYAPPKSETEQSLIQIWENVLQISPIGIHDNFFELGGHSLAATRVVSQVIKHFQLELPLQALFEAPTIAEMAAIINQNHEKRASEAKLTEMLRQIEAMTEEEAQKLLAQDTSISESS
jgi:acyl-coenzyme A synthetase/AMP-(fatty) acid ligase/acyl carrier protein